MSVTVRRSVARSHGVFGAELRPRRVLVRRLALAAIVAGAMTNAASAECKGPAALESAVHAHPGATSYTKLGTWFGEQQQFTCANDAFTAALKFTPRSAMLNYFLGLSLHSSGQDGAAVTALQRSIKLDSKAIQPKMLLVAIDQQQGKRAEADEQLKQILKIDPASKEALGALSNSMIDGGDPAGAIGLLTNAKRDEDLDLDLARAYGQARMLPQAASTVQSALARYPDSLRLTNALVTVYIQQGRFQDAATLLRKFIDKHPSDDAAQISYLGALVLNKDYANARPLGQKLLATAPHDFNVLYLNGLLAREAGDYATARDLEQQAVQINPQNYSAHYNLGAALAHLDDAAGAKAQLEKAIELDPSQPESHFQLASVLRSLGDEAGAQQQLALYQQASHSGTTRARADSKAALAAQKLAAGDAAQAVSLYREAVAEAPDDALFNYQLSVALDQAGDETAEHAALENAIRIDPTLAIAQNQLGYLDSRNGDPASAEKHFRLAVQAAPSFTGAWINLAATLGQETHIAEAKEAVANALRLEPSNAQAIELSRALSTAAHP